MITRAAPRTKSGLPQRTKATVTDWALFSHALICRNRNAEVLLGETTENGSVVSLLQMFIGLPWTSTRRDAVTGLKTVRQQQRGEKRRAIEDAQARANDLQQLKDQITAAETALADTGAAPAFRGRRCDGHGRHGRPDRRPVSRTRPCGVGAAGTPGHARPAGPTVGRARGCDPSDTMIAVTTRRTLGAGPEAPDQGIRATQADLLDTLPGVRIADLGELRARGVVGHLSPAPPRTRRTWGQAARPPPRPTPPAERHTEDRRG
ncbi:hypothetical protein QF026_001514 [Streptomyces aurantiacus]|nr:hypothetical protein [Streptomyces aurantiacus]